MDIVGEYNVSWSNSCRNGVIHWPETMTMNPKGHSHPYSSNSLSIRQEIQRFESVHPSIYSIYDLIEAIPDPLIQQQIREHVVCIEGKYVFFHLISTTIWYMRFSEFSAPVQTTIWVKSDVQQADHISRSSSLESRECWSSREKTLPQAQLLGRLGVGDICLLIFVNILIIDDDMSRQFVPWIVANKY